MLNWKGPDTVLPFQRSKDDKFRIFKIEIQRLFSENTMKKLACVSVARPFSKPSGRWLRDMGFISIQEFGHCDGRR